MVTSVVKMDEAPVSGYLVKHLRPLTDADPVLLANYVLALLKNNKPKKELQKLCVDQLQDFLGEGTRAFVVNLFHALEDGSIFSSHIEFERTRPKGTVAVSICGEVAESRTSPQPEKFPSKIVGAFRDQGEGTDDEDDDRNHKHRRHVIRSRSFDRENQDEFKRAYHRECNRPAENDHFLRDSIAELCQGPGLIYLNRGSAKYDKRIGRDQGYGPTVHLNAEGDQRIVTVGPPFRGDGPSPRFEKQISLNRGALGRGRGAWAPHEQQFPPFDGTDLNQSLLPPGPPPTIIYSSREMSSRGNPPLSHVGAHGGLSGIRNGPLDQILSPNTRLHQGGRGIAVTSGRPSCPDFEERGYCLQGDRCLMEHGANMIVVEDVQSLSQFNLPGAFPTGRGMEMGSAPSSGGPSAPMSSGIGLASSAPALDEPGLAKGAMLDSIGIEPDLYDPDEPLWRKDHPKVSNGLRRLRPFRKGTDEHDWESGAPDRQGGHFPDDADHERHGMVASTASLGLQAMQLGSSVWDRIGPVDRRESREESDDLIKNPEEGLGHVKFCNNDFLELQKPQSRMGSGQGKWERKTDDEEENACRTSTVNAHHGKDHTIRREAGVRTVEGNNFGSREIITRGNNGSGTERAQRTLYVSCIPSSNKRKENLLSHFKKFGEVLDIRIPAQSDKAFVQFLRSEDAESALLSPDAVMGNRFIRLSWANRDSISDSSGEGNMSSSFSGRNKGSGSGSGFGPGSAVGTKEKVTSGHPASEANPIESAVKFAAANGQPSSSAALNQKKQEEIKLMKVEIRRKHEELAHKRDDFRRKLDQFSKHSGSTRGVSEAEQPMKRPKLEDLEGSSMGSHKSGSADTVSSQPLSSLEHSAGGSPKLIVGERNISCSGPALPGTFPQPSPMIVRTPFPRPMGANMGLTYSHQQWGSSRYKLDNRTTVLMILPPFPDGLVNITTVKEHFAGFGEVLNVELEDREGHKLEGCLNLTQESPVRVTFASRQSAEKAFVQGRWFQGVCLKLAWFTPTVSPAGNVTPSARTDINREDLLIRTVGPSSNGMTMVEQSAQEEGKPIVGEYARRSQEGPTEENLFTEEGVQLADEYLQSSHAQMIFSQP